MGVYNEEDTVSETIGSIICQTFENFQFIIVDDGSSDRTGDILREFSSKDPRIWVIVQENAGLTKALIRGCSEAEGRYIARQDAGDSSHPDRLKQQVEMLQAWPTAVMTSCGTQFIGPQQELLYSISNSSQDLQSGLAELDLAKIRGPSHHGSTMFSRQAYEQVGGYRSEFLVAQDLDLWMRLAEHGLCVADESLLYRAQLAPGRIGSIRRDEQIQSARTILACAKARRAKQDEAAILAAWVKDEPGRRLEREASRKANHVALEKARFYYFIASLLLASRPDRSRQYFTKAIRQNLFHLPAWLGFIRATISR